MVRWSLPGAHVFCGEYEDAFGADPVLRRCDLELNALDVEDPGAGLAADDLPLLVTDPAVAVILSVLKRKVYLSYNGTLKLI